MRDLFRLEAIGRLRTPFPDKFGIPRQAGLVDLPGVIEMAPPYDELDFFEGLEEVSHLWVTFLFHRNLEQRWKGRVRPPRLGGNRRLGVFATRSPYRPNHLGLSAVRLRAIESRKGRSVKLRISGVDMLDGSPVVDIKPYLPYADAVAGARGGFADSAPEPRLQVGFTAELESRLRALPEGEELAGAVRALIGLDPRPAYAAGSGQGRIHGMALYRWDFRWRVEDGGKRAVVFGMESRDAAVPRSRGVAKRPQ